MSNRTSAIDSSTRFARALEKRVLRYIQTHALFQPGEKVLVALSGGPDSTALLLILARLRQRLAIDLAVAHFDHQLRPADQTAADANYVRRLAEALRLPAAFGGGDVRQHARRHGLSTEDAARQLRYAFLARRAARLRAAVVAVGHTASDQAETVLLHIVRGSGLDGLVGMRPRGPWPLGDGPVLARPLLEVSRADTERYCRDLKLEPRSDPTNLLLEATRNRVRHQLLPLLRDLNPAVEQSLLRLAAASVAFIDYLDQEIDALWPGLAQEQAGSVAFPRQRLAALPPVVAARLLRRAARRLLGPGADLEAVHLQAMLAALTKARSRLNLPHRLTFAVRGDLAVLTLGQPSEKTAAPLPTTPLAVPGRTALPGWAVQARLIARPKALRLGNPCEAYLDADAVGPEPIVRSRRPGDRLRPLGLGGEKKVHDLLVDAKVPASERDAVPIVCAPWGVAWVVGHRLDERAAVSESTKRVLHLRFAQHGGRHKPRSS